MPAIRESLALCANAGSNVETVGVRGAPLVIFELARYILQGKPARWSHGVCELTSLGIRTT